MKRLPSFVLGLAFAAATFTAAANNYVGDYAPGTTAIRCSFGTVQPSTGASFALAGTPVISIYKDGGTTESTSGVTLTASLDSRSGLNHIVVDTSSDGTFYSAGSYFDAVITTGTVDSVSVVGQPVCAFSLNKVAALRPTTAGRTLVVDSSGLADANTVKVGPTGSGTAQTAKDLGALNVTTVNTLAGHDPGETIMGATDLGTGSGFTSLASAGNLATANTALVNLLRGMGQTTTIATLASQTSFTLTAGSTDDNAYNGWGALIVDASTATQTALGCVSDYTGSTKTITLASDPAIFTMATSDNITLLPSFCRTPVEVDQTVALDTGTAGSIGEAWGAASSAGDPWTTALPGSYTSGQAGYIVGTNLDALISSRLAPTTSGRTLDVTATGAAGIDWGNVENKTTTNALTGTTIATTQQVDVNTIKTQAVTAAAGVTFPSSIASTTNITAASGVAVSSLGANVITAASIAADAIGTSEASALATATALSTLSTKIGTPADTDIATDIANVAAQALANQTQLFSGTADSGDTDTLVDGALSTPFSNDVDLPGAYVVRSDGQRCFVSTYTALTGTVEFGSCTFTGAWSTQTYKLYPAGTQ